MIKNKRGWIRIVEAVAGILLLAGVLLVVYSQHQTASSSNDYVYELQKQFLEKVASDDNLRAKVFEVNGEESLQDTANLIFPNNFNFNVSICELGAISCGLDEKPLDKEIFVEDRIVTPPLGFSEFSPKKVRIFVWEK